MGDEGEIWRKHRVDRSNKKNSNYEKSKKLILASGVEYTEKPNGQFIIWDYTIWLTTGLFIHNKTRKRGRGIRNLLKKVVK